MKIVLGMPFYCDSGPEKDFETEIKVTSSIFIARLCEPRSLPTADSGTF